MEGMKVRGGANFTPHYQVQNYGAHLATGRKDKPAGGI